MRILVCNRGEIACRIIKSIKKLNHEAVVIYSTEDKDALFVKEADYAVCIGPGDPRASYLNVENILVVATSFGVDAIHPGYGFLSENAEFVEHLESLNIKFIGPSSKSIELMGNKINALKTMQDANPDYDLNPYYEVHNHKEVLEACEKLKLPIIIKYANGGGGKGIRVVKKHEQLIPHYDLVVNEAQIFEKNPKILIEKYVEQARHVEVQIIADQYQNVCHLLTRDCSIQRNGQKIIEEAPAILDKKIENKLCHLACNVVKYINYEGVGTLEFMVKDDSIYFLEMNTRLQVEHTVTEEIANLDLVELQIKIAFGEKLPFKQEDLIFTGHAIECRINAEQPINNFAPAPGIIKKLELVDGKNVRNDFGFETNDMISPFYDSMIGKIIIKAKSRDEAILKMLEVLGSTTIDHPTTIDFIKIILNDDTFKENRQVTTFINDNFSSLIEQLKG